jgi:hypothetical protein
MVRDVRYQTKNKLDQPRVYDGFISMPDYRNDLVDLVKELAANKYAHAKILGTFDQLLAMSWATQSGHMLFIPDTFLSLASDDLIEARTIYLCRLTGFSEEDFMKKTAQMYFQWRFLTLAKWQATTNFLASPPEDYNISQLRRALETDPLDYWSVAIPIGVQERLRKHYRSFDSIDLTPDLIILTDEPSYRELSGPSRGFDLTYQNRSFRVFLRDGLSD